MEYKGKEFSILNRDIKHPIRIILLILYDFVVAAIIALCRTCMMRK